MRAQHDARIGRPIDEVFDVVFLADRRDRPAPHPASRSVAVVDGG